MMFAEGFSRSFMSQVTGKFQGFVNVKTGKDSMILPVEVVVVKGTWRR